MSIGERIKQQRIKQGKTQEDIAQALNTGRATIHKYETGLINNIPPDKVLLLAKVLHCSPSYLMGWEEKNHTFYLPDNVMPLPKMKKVPLLGEIACGEPIFASEEFDSYIKVEDGLQIDFCLKCKGDSMINARIHDGDIVFIRKQEAVENGEIAAVIIGDEATLKRVYYYPEENRISLIAENPLYPPLIYTNEQLELIKILGKAVAFQSRVK